MTLFFCNIGHFFGITHQQSGTGPKTKPKKCSCKKVTHANRRFSGLNKFVDSRQIDVACFTSCLLTCKSLLYSLFEKHYETWKFCLKQQHTDIIFFYFSGTTFGSPSPPNYQTKLTPFCTSEAYQLCRNIPFSQCSSC